MSRMRSNGMRKIQSIMAAAIITTLASFTMVAQAQRERAYRLSDRQVREIVHSLERDAKSFRSSLDHALDHNALDGTQREDDVNARIKGFEEATKQLHDHFDKHRSVAGDVQNVLDRASHIDEFMRRQALDRRAQGDWSAIRSDLDRLASAYTVTWRWQETYPTPGAAVQPSRIDDRQVERLLGNTEKAAEAFRRSLDHALDGSRLDGTDREDDVNQFVKEFNEATKQLRDRFDGHTSVAADVESVLNRAGRIDAFMLRHTLDRNAQQDWTRLRSDLDQLAGIYSFAWNWKQNLIAAER